MILIVVIVWLVSKNNKRIPKKNPEHLKKKMRVLGEFFTLESKP
jgi:hypothetical protein